MDSQELQNRFTYHPVDQTTELANTLDLIRLECANLAKILNIHCVNDNREKSLAMTHLEEVMSWAVASLVRYQ